MSRTLEDIIRENATPIARADAERKHLEGLLKDRINFHLLFGSVFMLGLFRIEESAMVRAVALAAITVVSALISLAVIRTHRLVQKALDDILTDRTHPYYQYREKVKFPPNANLILVWVPIVLTLAFGTGTFYFFKQATKPVKGGAASGPKTPDSTTTNSVTPVEPSTPNRATPANKVPANDAAPTSKPPASKPSGNVTPGTKTPSATAPGNTTIPGQIR